MHARVLTLRYSAETGSFDDCELQQLATKHDLLDLREHVVSIAGEPFVILVVRWQPRATTTHIATADTTAQPPTSTRRTDARKPTADVLQGLNDAQRKQFESIRAWRSTTAHDEGVPPYVILTNRQLVEVVKHRPDSRTALSKIDGLGDKKLGRYGHALLTLLHPGPADADAATRQPDAEATS
tara:strand:- start:48538 stop:49086 length:549 start_codon:yes stop_codon:yes gene_type:complete